MRVQYFLRPDGMVRRVWYVLGVRKGAVILNPAEAVREIAARG